MSWEGDDMRHVLPTKEQMHGRYIIGQGALKRTVPFPPNNPLTATGKKVMASMRRKYGKRAREVFYRSINKGVPGSSKWHK
jgi:hypothetical protein